MKLLPHTCPLVFEFFHGGKKTSLLFPIEVDEPKSELRKSMREFHLYSRLISLEAELFMGKFSEDF